MRHETDYELLCKQLEGILDGVDYEISNLANASALIWESMEDINWAGFYILIDGELKLGPFQGKVACTGIQIGRGVCGSAVAEDQTKLVMDVHQFPGHIACDAASNSEIVVPIHRKGAIYGVLDIDSPLTGRFNDIDRAGLEKFVRILEERL